MWLQQSSTLVHGFGKVILCLRIGLMEYWSHYSKGKIQNLRR